MNRHFLTALAAVAFAASSAAFACDYSAMDDGVALAPADASKVPVAAASGSTAVPIKFDKPRAAAPKAAAKSVVVAVKNAPSEPQAVTPR